MFETYKKTIIQHYLRWERFTIIPRFLSLLVIIIYSVAAGSKPEELQNKLDYNTDSVSYQDSPDVDPLWYRENVLDTVYTTKDYFVEVRLKEQRVYLHHRSGKTDTFLCSTGTEFVEKGQKTDPGIFTVKSRMPVLVSKQFNDTKCLNWVGFSFGIGFHALEKKNYYWSLGKRPSSHGCIRMTQESSKELFDKVSIGTPVMVRNSENSARIIMFTEKINENDTLFSKKAYHNSLKEKLNNLYKNRYFYKGYPKTLLTDKYIGHEGLEVGDYEKVPKIQRIPLFYHGLLKYYINPDRTSVKMTIGLNEKETTADSLKSRQAAHL